MAGVYHEPVSELSPRTREIHRALSSLMEELEAVDWYQQRIDAASDESLIGVLVHNRNDELEHAAMALEWLRREMPEFDEMLKTYLFTCGDLVKVEKQEDESPREPDSVSSTAGLGIGQFEKGS